jgi:LmbE family N-acetylglucosaminyl deacetylase
MQITSLDQINRNYRHIYLQPHFDDAALSCGGAIGLQAVAGQRPLIVTIFGGIPAAGAPLSTFASASLQRMGLGQDAAEAVRRRRAEDAAASEVLHADTYWLDFPDAIFRGSPAYYTGDEALFGTVNPGDLPLDEQIAAILLNVAERAPLAAIYAPLGIGNHVDHQLVCSAADRLAQRKLNVKFYEDFPYVARQGGPEARQATLSIPMEPELVEISGLLPTKEDAILQYASQVPQLFGNEERMRQMLRQYSASLRRTYPGVTLERYWRWLPAAKA